MNGYKIFLSATDEKIEDKVKMRIDLFGDMKIKDIKELEHFKIFYFTKGHNDFISINGEKISRKVRYVKIFEK